MNATAYELVALSRKDDHLVHIFSHPQYCPRGSLGYAEARQLLLGLRGRMPAFSQPGFESYLMVRPCTSPWTEPDLGDPIVPLPQPKAGA